MHPLHIQLALQQGQHTQQQRVKIQPYVIIIIISVGTVMAHPLVVTQVIHIMDVVKMNPLHIQLSLQQGQHTMDVVRTTKQIF